VEVAVSDAIKPRGCIPNATAEVQAFRINQASMAAQIAVIEGRAMICGHDPISKRDYTIAMTRIYTDRRPVEDGYPLADELDTHDDKE
jgi:hypothetical protein